MDTLQGRELTPMWSADGTTVLVIGVVNAWLLMAPGAGLVPGCRVSLTHHRFAPNGVVIGGEQARRPAVS